MNSMTINSSTMKNSGNSQRSQHLARANETSIKTLSLKKSMFTNYKSSKTLTFCDNCKNSFTASLSPRIEDSNFTFQRLQENKKEIVKSNRLL